MAVFALTSLSGAPGVTSAAACWAMNATRPTIVIEADPAGGSPILAGAFGSKVEHSTSVLNLVTPRPGVTLMDRLMDQAVQFPTNPESSLLPGVAGPDQATSLRGLWPSLGAHLQKMSQQGGYDVVVDLGRLSYPALTSGLFPHLDALGVFVRADLPSLHVLVSGLGQLRRELGEESAAATTLTRAGLILLEAPTDSNPASAVKSATKPVPVLATLPHTTHGVRPFTLGTPVPERRGLAKITKADEITRYARAVQSMTDSLRTHAQAYTDTLIGE